MAARPGLGAKNAVYMFLTSIHELLYPKDDMDLELTYFDDALASFESGGAMSHHSTRLSRLAVLLTLEELGDLIALLRSVQGRDRYFPQISKLFRNYPFYI